MVDEIKTTEIKTSTGMNQNVAGMLCYLVGWITGLIFFLIEKENKFVRFHAMQSMLVFGPACVALLLCLSIPLIGWVLSIFIVYGSAILWLILMFKAYQGERFKLPIVGDMAEQRI